MRVAIATFEFEGLTRNGGIGTAYRNLADLLHREGHEVFVYLFPFSKDVADAKEAANSHICNYPVEIIEELPSRVGNLGYALRSYHVFQVLRGKAFDVLHIPDSSGMGLYSFNAKKAGIDFASTRFVVGCHGPTAWASEISNASILHPDFLSIFRFEQLSIQRTDHLVSPSRYMLEHLSNRKWKTPRSTHVIGNVNTLDQRTTDPRIRTNRTKKGLVFYGRLEERKGIHLFLETLKELQRKLEADQKNTKPLELYFLGKDTLLQNGKKASTFILENLKPLRKYYKPRFLPDLSSAQARTFLKEREDLLVCIPSPAENLPYVIVDALEMGCDFLASKNGGGKELVRSKSRYLFFARPTPQEFGRRVFEKLRRTVSLPRPSNFALKANEHWLRFHDDLMVKPFKKKQAAKTKTSDYVGFFHKDLMVSGEAKLQMKAMAAACGADLVVFPIRDSKGTTFFPPTENFLSGLFAHSFVKTPLFIKKSVLGSYRLESDPIDIPEIITLAMIQKNDIVCVPSVKCRLRNTASAYQVPTNPEGLLKRFETSLNPSEHLAFRLVRGLFANLRDTLVENHRHRLIRFLAENNSP